MMVGPMRPRPRELATGGASTRAISSQNMACCISEALRPPYSLGHETAAQRPSRSFRCQARRYGNDSSMGFSRQSLQSFGTLEASQARSSSRNVNSSAVKFKSMNKTPSCYLARTALCFYLLRNKSLSIRPAQAPDFVLDAGAPKSGRIVSLPCQYFLRRSFFKIFPVPVLGKLSTNSTERGHL